MDGMNDLIICQDDVSMWHPDFMQIFDLCCDQSITEAALQASGAITALHSGLSQIGDPCGAVCLLWPRRTKRKYRFDCCVVDWVLIRICRISIDHVKYISSTYAERLSGLYSALSRLFRHIVLLCSFERPAVAVQANSSAQFCAGK